MSILAPILIFLLIIFIVILFVGFSLLRGVLSIFFPSMRNKKAFYGNQNPFGQQQSSENTNKQSQNQFEDHEGRGNHGHKKKIFDQTDGEYVDFEEYKEEEK